MAKDQNKQQKKAKSNKANKKPKYAQEESSQEEEVYYDSDSEGNQQAEVGNTNRLIAGNKGDTIEEQSQQQIYQDGIQSPKEKTNEQIQTDLHAEGDSPKVTVLSNQSACDQVPFGVSKKIRKSKSNKSKGNFKQQEGHEQNAAKIEEEEDDHDIDDVVHIQEQSQLSKELKSELIMKMQSYFNNIFTSQFFTNVAELATESIFESKHEITPEEIKKLTAFLLFTSQCKMDHINDYFSNPFSSVSNVLSQELFCFIVAALSANRSNIDKLSIFLTSSYDLLMHASSSCFYSLSKRFQSPQLIKSNYLGFLDDYSIDFSRKEVRSNPSFSLRNQCRGLKTSYTNAQNSPKNQEHSEILIKGVEGGIKVSLKKQIDEILSKKKIFSHQSSSLKASQQSLPNLLFDQEMQKMEREIDPLLEKGENKEKEDSQRYLFCYNPTTLSLVSIQQVEQSVEITTSSKLSQKHKKSQKISSQEAFFIDSQNPNPNGLEGVLFNNQKEDSIHTLLATIYNKYRILSNINLDNNDNEIIRSYSEVIYSLCVTIFQNLILVDYEHIFQDYKKYKTSIESLFKDTLNELIQFLMPVKKQQQPIPVEIVVARHSLQKMKHCNFCLVCKCNTEKAQALEDDDNNSDNEKNAKKKKSKYECTWCSQYYGKTIPLCIEYCDEEFHKHPHKYLESKSKSKRQQNKQNYLKQIGKNHGAGSILEELTSVEAIFEAIINKVETDRFTALDNVFNQRQNKLRKRPSQALKQQQNQKPLHEIPLGLLEGSNIKLSETIEKIKINLHKQENAQEQNINYDEESAMEEEKEESENPNSQNELDEQQESTDNTQKFAEVKLDNLIKQYDFSDIKIEFEESSQNARKQCDEMK